ncbi:MAG: hypothetical protein QOF10_2036 [Kribbellaceae bacterium]|jgi:hypothetical protein|nr:hypothetical protein [Kribbellaceae bacterium]
MESEDSRRRPVVLQARSADPDSARRPARYLTWTGSGLLAVAAAAGLVAGGTAVWAAFDPGTPGQSPAPLWFPPPANVRPQNATVAPTPTPDDHGGRRTSTTTPSSGGTIEPGDDKGGLRKSGSSSTTEPGDDKGGLRKSGGGGSGKSGSGGSGHR